MDAGENDVVAAGRARRIGEPVFPVYDRGIWLVREIEGAPQVVLDAGRAIARRSIGQRIRRPELAYRLERPPFELGTARSSLIFLFWLSGGATPLVGRFADRTSRPLRCYAWLEAGIGATGLLVPPGFAALTTVCRSSGEA